MFLGHSLLTLLILLPLSGSILLLSLPQKQSSKLHFIALSVSGIEFLCSLLLFPLFDDSSHLFQLVQKTPWIKDLGISYFVGVDGLSFWLILLTTFLTPLVILGSQIQKHLKAYYAALLILETAMVGTFVALDLFLFYIFWELMLIPMYFIIGIWGGEGRLYATMKFLIYTLAGGVLMLLGIIFLIYLHHDQFGFFSTSLLDMYAVDLPFGGGFFNTQTLLFFTFALAFMIKVPMFPFHTWLPDAHVEAPTGGSVILAAVLLKMGAYGFLRFAIPLFPEAYQAFLPVLITLALTGVIYGALLALAQTDLKKLVAYSSISHMGLVMLGLFVLNTHGFSGSLFQMLSHGISTGALFFLVGMLYERRHTKEISQFGGLAKIIPTFAVFTVIITLSSIALPTTNGFVGEFLILLGSYEKHPVLAVLGGTTVILGAVYMLRMVEKVIFGTIRHPQNELLKDLSLREWIVLVPLVILVFWMGLYPHTFIKKFERSVDHMTSQAKHYELGIYEKK